MHARIHLMIAISISMIITLILHCIVEHIPSRNSFLQHYWIDSLRDMVLIVRCVYNLGMSIYSSLIMVLSTFSFL
jgi:hypothetical protein